MAESIIIHFRKSDVDRIEEVLERRFGPQVNGLCVFPVHEYLVIVSPYSDYDGEYDDEDKAEVETKLGEKPAVSYDFEIRRSQSDQACDLLEDFVRQDLSDFTLAVNDMIKIWSLEEIAAANDFLDIYRYAKHRQHK